MVLFTFQNGEWQTVLPNSKIKVWVPGNQKTREVSVEKIKFVIKNISLYDKKAREKIAESPYDFDVKNGGGIYPYSIRISSENELVVWYEMRESYQCVAVRFTDDVPVDVYCDQP